MPSNVATVQPSQSGFQIDGRVFRKLFGALVREKARAVGEDSLNDVLKGMDELGAQQARQIFLPLRERFDEPRKAVDVV